MINNVSYDKDTFRVSYSEYKKWAECPLKHKLDVIDGLDNFEGNIHTVFGSAIHDYAQRMIGEGKELTYTSWNETFLKFLQEKKEILGSWDSYFDEWEDQGYLILLSWLNYMKTDLHDFKFIEFEQELMEPIPFQYCDNLVDDRKEINGEPNPNFNHPPFFKGFIDLVLVDSEDNHHIIDFKTATKPWDKWKTDDNAVIAQLKLYKFFYHQKHDIPLKKIKTWYYVMPRTKSNTHRQIIDFNFSPQSITKELQKLNIFFRDVYNNKVAEPILTQQRCRFCVYKGTQFCPKSKVMM